MTDPGMVEVDREYLAALETIVAPETSYQDMQQAREIVARHDRVSALEYSDMKFKNEQ